LAGGGGVNVLLVAPPNAPGVALLAQSLLNLREWGPYWLCEHPRTATAQVWQEVIDPLGSGRTPEGILRGPTMEAVEWPERWDAVYLIGIALDGRGATREQREARQAWCFGLLNRVAQRCRVEHLTWQSDTVSARLPEALEPGLVLSYRPTWQCAAGCERSAGQELAWLAAVCNRDSRLVLEPQLREELWRRSWGVRFDSRRDLPGLVRSLCAGDLPRSAEGLLERELAITELDAGVVLVEWFADEFLEAEHLGELALRRVPGCSWAICAAPGRLALCGDWRRPAPIALREVLPGRFTLANPRLAFAYPADEEELTRDLAAVLRGLGVTRGCHPRVEQALRMPRDSARYLQRLTERLPRFRHAYHRLHNLALFEDVRGELLSLTAGWLEELGDLPAVLRGAQFQPAFETEAGLADFVAALEREPDLEGRRRILRWLDEAFRWEGFLEVLGRTTAPVKPFSPPSGSRPVYVHEWLEAALVTWLENARKYAGSWWLEVRYEDGHGVLAYRDEGGLPIASPTQLLLPLPEDPRSTGQGLRWLGMVLIGFGLELRAATPDFACFLPSLLECGGARPPAGLELSVRFPVTETVTPSG